MIAWNVGLRNILKWEGNVEQMWEPQSNLDNCAELLSNNHVIMF